MLQAGKLDRDVLAWYASAPDRNRFLRTPALDLEEKAGHAIWASLMSGYQPDPEVGLLADIAEGQTVEHERFGKGKVLKVEGNAPDLKATVFFPSAGQKQLLLRFAKLTVVEG